MEFSVEYSITKIFDSYSPSGNANRAELSRAEQSRTTQWKSAI